jgi:hypothetical protein
VKKTTVMNVRGHRPDELLARSDFVYVGRAVPRVGWKASIWGNPNHVRRGEDPAKAVDVYREFIETALDFPMKLPSDCSPYELDEQTNALEICLNLYTLRGKCLGCWCCDWDGTGEPERPCHAVVLAQLADSLDDPEDPRA